MSPQNVNVHNALELGNRQMEEFEAGWPASFHKNLKKTVKTMPDVKKSIKIDDTPVYDTELLYSRIIGLQQSREMNIQDVLSYELSAVPSALFDKYGDMRSSSKAMLKSKLEVEVSDRCTSKPDAIIIDGCALLWSVHWPASSTVHQYIKNFVTRLHEYLNNCCVYLIFDRYPATSTKSTTRSNCAGANVSRTHVLSLHTTLPAQKVVLNVTHNKTQLITLITKYLVDHLEDNQNELVVTSEDPVPIAIRNGEVVRRDDLRNTHEDADVIIVNQLVDLAGRGANNIRVVCDDTDVFILMLHFYCGKESKLWCHHGEPCSREKSRRHTSYSQQTYRDHRSSSRSTCT